MDKILQTVGLELMFCTPQKCESGCGLTAVELAKRLNLKPDIVKKKLKILQEKGIVRSIGINPKYWQFDNYNFQRMDEEDEVYKMLCDFENVDFGRYFQY
ncbi:MAG: hypothetical protein PHV68_06430 [Candidatus Gastranaerophilales bacterium]|nr:hypothetical protein [Candidatus Gastranaerophilales bacterium]